MIKVDIKDLAPHTLFAIVLFSLIFLCLVSPLEYLYYSNSIFLLVLACLIFWASSFSVTTLLQSKPSQNRFEKKFSVLSPRVYRLINICIFFASLGVFLRFLDFFFLRGYDFSQGLVSLRLSLQSLTYSETSDLQKAGSISALGAVLFGFTYPLAVLVLTFGQNLSSKKRYFSYFLISTPIIESGLVAGIMGAVFTVLYIFFSLSYRWKLKNNYFDFRKLSIILFSVFIVFAYGAFSFISRIDQMFSIFSVYFESSTSLVLPNDWLMSKIENSYFSTLAFFIFWFSSYVLQGPVEFAYLVDNFNGDNFTFGAKQFFVVDKFLGILGVTSFDAFSITEINPRPGRYQTVFGDVFIDFGLVGILFQAFIFGALSAITYVYRRRGFLWALVLYPFFQASIVSGFLINSFSGARFYFFVGALLLIVVYFLSDNRSRLSFGG
ncbi:O-antigen polymerase [Marinobacter nauticus]|uniref:Oligosaccharide repeat unit polymerase n=1 Tax=Marinobacter nauticus TaxID=2743 RepID=A0A368UPW3_MARNT|nr:O-antigen polymerase [Marinobacter nauticus]RBP69264.1 oligosaccharide repeat unit polymerase [Marinobacter nauticus]RCW30743.1 oligosaccharide repeat unit polymerase [Marinobacter nauticus]